MSRPIEGDGTIRYSTGRPGREKAPAVADPPANPIRPGSAAAATPATASRFAVPRNFSTNFTTGLLHDSVTYRLVTRVTKVNHVISVGDARETDFRCRGWTTIGCLPGGPIDIGLLSAPGASARRGVSRGPVTRWRAGVPPVRSPAPSRPAPG